MRLDHLLCLGLLIGYRALVEMKTARDPHRRIYEYKTKSEPNKGAQCGRNQPIACAEYIWYLVDFD